MSSDIKALLEKVVSKLDELDKRISALENGRSGTTQKPRTNVIETSKFTTTVQKAKKGVGMAIRFAKFVKIENNTVYVVLTEEEAERFVKGLYREIMKIVGTNTNGKGSVDGKKVSGRGAKVKIVEE